MIITDYHIDLYSRCPKRSQFQWTSVPQEVNELAFFRYVVQKVIVWNTKFKEPPTWKQVFRWAADQINSIIVGSVKKENFTQSQKLLSQLNDWYHNIFLPAGGTIGIPNVPLFLNLANSRLELKVDLLSWDPQPTLVQFEYRKAPTSTRILFEKPSIYAKLWLLNQLLSVKTNHCRIIYILPESVQVRDKELSDEQLRRGALSTDFILKGIQSQIFYPSITEQCNYCPYRTKCYF